MKCSAVIWATLVWLSAPGSPATTRARGGEIAHPSEAAAPGDLYRRRGYGQGGAVFGLGRAGDGLAQAGTCAGLRFADPPGCGAKGGFGLYGNGLGQNFGR